MKTYNWEGVNPDGYFLDKLEPIPSALPSFQKLFRSEERFSRNAETDLVCRLLLEKKNPECVPRAQLGRRLVGLAARRPDRLPLSVALGGRRRVRGGAA